MPDTSPNSKKRERCIPFFLQQRLPKKGNNEGDSATASPGGRRGGLARSKSSRTTDPQRTFTAPQLEDLIWKTSQTIVDLQKQIQRGEETYYEETQTHGSSLYRGFETFIDARDVGSGPSSSSSSSSGRRMPGDYRWFSSSCANISRHEKQRFFVPTPAPLSGQKRSAETAANSPPSKERKVEEPEGEEVKTPKEEKGKAGRTAANKTNEPKRRTTRKRKANS